MCEDVSKQLSGRFPDDCEFRSLGIFDPTSFPADKGSLREYGKSEVTWMCDAYCGPWGLSELDVHSQWELYKNFVANNCPGEKVANVRAQLVEYCAHHCPDLYRFLELALILPLHTADVERGFSAMNRLKNGLRNRLKSHTVSNLLTCTLSPCELRLPDALRVWQSEKKRYDVDETA